LGWLGSVPAASALRRLQLATQRGGIPAFLFRPLSESAHTSAAELRIACESLPPGSAPLEPGARLQLLKSRGGRREAFTVYWNHGKA
ncbi:MAG: hypothetical protein ACO3P5_08310, partial [Steroidobacteraceae bacterium]